MSTDLSVLEQVVIASARGGAKRPQELALQYVRDLNAGDLDLILNPPEVGAKVPVIKQLRHTHHLAARLLAEGRKPGEVSLMTGYANSTISNLQTDPAFGELVEYYKQQKDGAWLEVNERLAALGLSFADELQNRLEESPEVYSVGQLLEGAKAFLDRSITKAQGASSLGGVAPAVTVNVNLVRPQKRPQGPVLDIDPEAQ